MKYTMLVLNICWDHRHYSWLILLWYDWPGFWESLRGSAISGLKQALGRTEGIDNHCASVYKTDLRVCLWLWCEKILYKSESLFVQNTENNSALSDQKEDGKSLGHINMMIPYLIMRLRGGRWLRLKTINTQSSTEYTYTILAMMSQTEERILEWFNNFNKMQTFYVQCVVFIEYSWEILKKVEYSLSSRNQTPFLTCVAVLHHAS